MNKRRTIAVSLKLLISVALIWFVLDAVGVEDSFARILSADASWLALALAIGMVQVLICTLRWLAVLKGIDADLGFVQAFKFWYVGAFFNQVLPSGAGGDVVRGYLAYKNGLAVGPVLNSLFLDRAATVLALVLLVASMTPFAAGHMDNERWFVQIVGLVLVGCFFGLAMIMVLDKLPASWSRFRLFKALNHLAVDARRVMLHPYRAGELLFWSVLGHLNLVLVVYVLFRAIDADVSLIDCLLVFPPVLLVQVIPASIAGWGIREWSMVSMFALVGIEAEAALAVSILFGLAMIVSSSPGLAVWLGLNDRLKTTDVEKFGDLSNQ